MMIIIIIIKKLKKIKDLDCLIFVYLLAFNPFDFEYVYDPTRFNLGFMKSVLPQ